MAALPPVTRSSTLSTGCSRWVRRGSSKVIRHAGGSEEEECRRWGKRGCVPARNQQDTEASHCPLRRPQDAQGMSPEDEQMQQMMANMPPEMRERMQARWPEKRPGRSRRGGGPGGSANSIPAHAGVTVPLDSALYTSFMRLKTQPVSHGHEHADQRSQWRDGPEHIQSGRIDSRGQYTPIHHALQNAATDVPGTVDDWEIRAVVQNGRGAG